MGIIMAALRKVNGAKEFRLYNGIGRWGLSVLKIKLGCRSPEETIYTQGSCYWKEIQTENHIKYGMRLLFCSIQQVTLGIPELFGKIHIVVMGVFKPLYLVPQRVQLLGTVAADVL